MTTQLERHGEDVDWHVDKDGDVVLEFNNQYEGELPVFIAPIDVLRMMAKLLDVEPGELKMDLVDKYGIEMDDTFAEGGD